MAGALVAALALGQPHPAWSQQPPPPEAAATPGQLPPSSYELCLARDEGAFRTAIENVTVQALERSIAGIDYKPVVAEEWRKGGIDDIVAARVDSTLEDIRQETSWSELISSLASKQTQEKLAKQAAERVYHSPEMKKAITGLAEGVGRQIGDRLTLAADDAAEEATRCLKDHLGPRFGRSVAEAVARDAGEKFAIDAAKSRAAVTSGNVLVAGKEGIAGLVVVIMRRQLGNLARRVGQRLVGAVLGRVVSAVAGGIGLVLIAKDIWELRNGVLPIIANEMKSPSTRDKVQAELAQSLATEINGHMREIGKRTAESVIEIWDDFRRAHAKVLELAERRPEFKSFSNNVSPENMARLDEVVALQLASGGEAAVMRRVADGSLAEAVERWPTAAFEIARDRRSLDAGFQWRALAGDTSLPKVLAFEVHRRARPEEMSRAALSRILELDDRLAITRLAALDRRALEPLLELDAEKLKALARALQETELASLARYLTSLEPTVGRELLRRVAQKPSAMLVVSSESARRAILASKDQAAAMRILLRGEDLFDAALFVRDVEEVRAGDVSARVLVVRYPIALTVLAFLALAALLLMSRAVFGRRPRRVRETENGSQSV